MKNWLLGFGALRLLLIGFVLLLTLVAPFSGGNNYDSAAVLITVVAPAMFVIMTFVLALDMLMSLLFRVDTAGAERRRMNRILKIEALVFIAMNLTWLPVVVPLVKKLVSA